MIKELIHFQIFGHPITIFSYGFMLVVAFLGSVICGKMLAKRNGIDPDHIVNAAMIALITGLAGARLSDVLENLNLYTRPDLSFLQNLGNAINIHQGGLTFYGGFLLATPCCVAYAWWHKIPILRGMDVVAPTLMIGLGLGRIGCFLNGCCYGAPSNLPWAMRFPYYSDVYVQQIREGEINTPVELLRPVGDFHLTLATPDELRRTQDASLLRLEAESRALPVQPTQLYSSITAFLVAALLIAYMSIRKLDGRVFALMLILEGASRFVLELIRVEPSVITMHLNNQEYGMSLSMVLGLGCVIAGIVMWIALSNREESAAKSPEIPV